MWVVGGAVLVVSGYMVSSLSEFFGWRRRREKNAPLKDSAEFRMVLRKWETLVVADRGTIREVKRFANRARFLTGSRGDGEGRVDVEALVGFVALEVCGRLDPKEDGFDFEEWCKKHANDQTLPPDWVGRVGRDQWEGYRELMAARLAG